MSILDSAAKSTTTQAALWQACSVDPLFWINTFVWTVDPRKDYANLPFITYKSYQDEAFTQILDHIYGNRDILIEKSRDMGASWLSCMSYLYCFLFAKNWSFLMTSRKESLVDGDEDSLFAHIDHVVEQLPPWMMPQGTFTRNKLKYVNHINGCNIEGESTTANIARGGRRRSIILDEYAAFEQGGWEVLSAVPDATRCVIFNSTPFGIGNAFYAQRLKTDRLRMHWSRHPEKSVGLYRPWSDGHEVIDHEFYDNLPGGEAGYKFSHQLPSSDEKLRSFWYDRECERRGHPVVIATQLDINYQGSDYPFFDHNKLDELRANFCTRPKFLADITLDDNDDEFIFSLAKEGKLKIWCDLDSRQRPPRDRDYVAGCDISQGTGASNSVCSIGDRIGGEKVAEYAANNQSPDQFARTCVAICKFFANEAGRGAHLIWEMNGPGSAFGKMVQNLGYSNVYFRKQESKWHPARTMNPGWQSSKETKFNLLSQYRTMLSTHQFLNPSQQSLAEAAEYVHRNNNVVEHAKASQTPDPSSFGDSHGDRVIADALCCKIICERAQKFKRNKVEDVPITSLRHRQKQRQFSDRMAAQRKIMGGTLPGERYERFKL